jgi:hypothetical protein
MAVDPEPSPAPKPPAKESTTRVDASVVLGSVPHAAGEQKSLPVSSRPLNGPLILGVLALITAVLLPLAVAF